VLHTHTHVVAAVVAHAHTQAAAAVAAHTHTAQISSFFFYVVSRQTTPRRKKTFLVFPSNDNFWSLKMSQMLVLLWPSLTMNLIVSEGTSDPASPSKMTVKS
jgi:hypothetical protein